jgi:predicted outer membrane protein
MEDRMPTQIRRAALPPLCAALFAITTACATPDPMDMPGGVQPSPVIVPQQDLWATSGLFFDGGLTSARFAVERAHDPAVRDQARRLAEYYGAAGPQFSELLRRHEIETRAGVEAERLRQAQQSEFERLGRFQGPDFDRHWIDHQITTNRGLLNRLDQQFLPAAAGRPTLEAELRTLREMIRQHTQEAERIRARWQ